MEFQFTVVHLSDTLSNRKVINAAKDEVATAKTLACCLALLWWWSGDGESEFRREKKEDEIIIIA